jgi:hypothetical protein
MAAVQESGRKSSTRKEGNFVVCVKRAGPRYANSPRVLTGEGGPGMVPGESTLCSRLSG